MICCQGVEGGCILCIIFYFILKFVGRRCFKVDRSGLIRKFLKYREKEFRIIWDVLLRSSVYLRVDKLFWELFRELMFEKMRQGIYFLVVVIFFLFFCSFRMDFLVFFVFYLILVFISGVMICVCLKIGYLKGSVRRGIQVIRMFGDYWILNIISLKGLLVF